MRILKKMRSSSSATYSKEKKSHELHSIDYSKNIRVTVHETRVHQVLHNSKKQVVDSRTSSLPEKSDIYGAADVELVCPLDLELDPNGLFATRRNRER